MDWLQVRGRRQSAPGAAQGIPRRDVCGEPICLSFGPSNSKCATHLLCSRDSNLVAMHPYLAPTDSALLLCSPMATLTRPSSARCALPASDG